MLDLNLLAALDALLDERSVTGAAGRLHLSVPATSRALGRLRVALDDELLVRAGREMVLTPRALELQPRTRALLRKVESLTQGEGALDPRTLHRTFAIRCNDAATMAFGGTLLETLAREAPGVGLRFLAEGDESPAALRNGDVDLDIGVQEANPSDIQAQPLGTEEMVGVLSVTHPLAGLRVTARRFAAAEHVSSSRRGRMRGPIDDALERAGLSRRVVATTGSIGAALLLAASSELVATVPASLTHAHATRLGLRVFTLPVDVPPLTYAMTWHRRLESDPAHRWMRGVIADVYRGEFSLR